MEINTFEQTSITVSSKKVMINTLDNPLLQQLITITSSVDKIQKIKTIKLQGNSYSREFFQYFGSALKKMSQNLIDLDINDVFVSRLKEEIPISIQYVAKGLIGSSLLRLDISNNAVNPFGAKALLNYLEQAKSLKVLLITNCGLGSLGVQEIAKGLKGTPSLETLSIGRNRMENQGILHIANVLEYIPELKELFIFQNTLKKQGLKPLFSGIRKYNHKLVSFDLCDNFVRQEATFELSQLIKQLQNLKNLNLSDCLNQPQNQLIIQSLQQTKNRSFERLGFNFIELNVQHAKRLLNVVKDCPLVRLDIVGNQFPKSVKKLYDEIYKGKGVLSKYQQDDSDGEQEITRLFQQMKI